MIHRNILWMPPYHDFTKQEQAAQAAPWKVIRDATGELNLYSTAGQKIRPKCQDTVGIDWIVDCRVKKDHYHWENCCVTQFKRKFFSYTRLLIQCQVPLWCNGGCPVGTANDTTLSLRIGGYLVDYWKFPSAQFHPITNTIDFVLEFDEEFMRERWTEQVPILNMECMPCPEKKTALVLMTFPIMRPPDEPLSRALGRITYSLLMPSGLVKEKLALYQHRYQEFFLDLLRSKKGHIGNVET